MSKQSVITELVSIGIVLAICVIVVLALNLASRPNEESLQSQSQTADKYIMPADICYVNGKPIPPTLLTDHSSVYVSYINNSGDLVLYTAYRHQVVAVMTGDFCQ